MRIEKIDKEGNVIKTFNNIENAAKEAKVSITTIQRQLGKWNDKPKKTHCGFTWRYANGETKQEEHKKKAIYIVDEDGNKMQRYNSIVEASFGTKYSVNMISHYLGNRCNKERFLKRHGVGFIYADDQEEIKEETKEEVKEEVKEIIKPEREEYYINILVGLVNRTLIDRAIYTIKGIDYTYIKEQDVLINNIKSIKRDYYCELCRTQLPLLNGKERIFLTNLLKAFKDVEGIEKCNDIYDGFEFLRIITSTPVNNTDLPKFKEGEYYTNLELNRVYSLDELEIK